MVEKNPNFGQDILWKQNPYTDANSSRKRMRENDEKLFIEGIE